MKYIFASIFVFLISLNANSQQFAPIGAKWYYTERYVGPGNWEDEYTLEVEAVNDSLIKGQNCIEINCDYLCWHPYNTQFVYSSNDTVFLYDSLLDTFKILYRFQALAGEAWNIPISGLMPDYGDYFRVTIDSVSIVMINDIPLIEQYVTYSCQMFDGSGELYESFWYNSRIVEQIGDLTYLFNIPEILLTWCDHNYSDGLRCYHDSIIGIYETGIAPTCDYEFVNLNQVHSSTSILYPNPTKDKIYFEPNIENLKFINLIDNIGRTVRSFLPTEEINLSGLSNGLYFLRLIDNRNNYYIEKVIKYGS